MKSAGDSSEQPIIDLLKNIEQHYSKLDSKDNEQTKKSNQVKSGEQYAVS